MIIYFSGTGNSRFLAKLLAKALDEPLADAASDIRAGEAGAYESDTPYIFVCPTYAWRMPRVFETYLSTCLLEGSKEAYFVMTCGGETGNAAAYIRRFCARKGLLYRGLLSVAMPENYIAMFEATPEEEDAGLVGAAAEKVLAAAEMIRQGFAFPETKATALDKIKSSIVNDGFYKFQIDPAKFTAGEDCTGCGLCASACPLANIRLSAGRPVWGSACTHCMACICRCPAGAIEWGKGTAGRRRYYLSSARAAECLEEYREKK